MLQNNGISDILNNASENNYLIYNKNNKLLVKKDIQHILSKANIHNRVNNVDIYQIAFTHCSYAKNCKKNKKFYSDNVEENLFNKDIDGAIELRDESSERLEWLGDGILQSVVSSYLWKRYGKQSDEGFLSRIRSSLVRTDMLSKFAKIYNLEKYIIMSQYVEVACNGRNNLSILEDCFEAFIGAMFLDFGIKNESKGFEICSKFILNTIEENIDITELILHDDNYKGQLSNFFRTTFSCNPVYIHEGLDEDTKMFIVSIYHPITNKNIGYGKSHTKKKAEKIAAKFALIFFGQIKYNPNN